MIFCNQFQHRGTFVHQEHFFPVPKNATVADSETFTDFFDAQTVQDKLENFPAARRQLDGRHIHFRLFSELVQ